MKKIMKFLLILSFLLMLISCSKEEVKTKQTTNSRFTGELENNVTIRILENNTAIEQGYFDELLAAFNEKYKDKGIQAVDARMDQYLDLEVDGPLGYGPDILYQANDVLMKFAENKHILPLPIENLETYESISNEGWSAYKSTIDSKEYTLGVPVNIQGPLLYYRKDLLPENWQSLYDVNKNEIPDMVETWNGLYSYSKKIIKESNNEQYGYMKAIIDPYFSSGFLFSYGAYVFGQNGTDDTDIGFSKGDAIKGAKILYDLASIMNQEASSYELTETLYSKLAQGTIFATMSTPDIKPLFIKQMANEYKKKNPALNDEDAIIKAEENLAVINVPLLPKNGDILNNKETEFIKAKMMGGINGYAISSYTENPNACLAFVDFATSYEMIKKRNDILEIVPAREDVATEIGGLCTIINKNLKEGNISLMPSIRSVGQIWSPSETFFSDLATDPFRDDDKKYDTDEKIKAGLLNVDQRIYDAIHTLN